MTVQDIQRLEKEVCELRTQSRVPKLEEKTFTSNNTKKLLYYTGLSNIELLY